MSGTPSAADYIDLHGQWTRFGLTQGETNNVPWADGESWAGGGWLKVFVGEFGCLTPAAPSLAAGFAAFRSNRTQW
jgi:hypothetical protein